MDTLEDLDTELDKESLPDNSATPPVNDATTTEPEIGTDSLGEGLNEEEGTSVYPVPDDKHIGVSTNVGASPQATDEVDEANDAILWGTPDDPFTEDVFPLPEKTEDLSIDEPEK
jgi:hypothetical protein